MGLLHKLSPLFKKRKVVALIIFLLLIGVIAGVFYIRNKKDLNLLAVEKKKIVRSIYASGYIDSSDSVSIKTQVSGYIKRIYVKENDSVSPRQILAELDRDVVEENLKEVSAQIKIFTERLKPESQFRRENERLIAIKKEEMENLKNIYERRKKLYEEELVSREHMDDIKKKYEISKLDYERQISSYTDSITTMQLNLKSLKARESSLRAELDKYFIKSPIGGKVLRKFVNEGEYVNPLSNNLLFTVGNMKNIETVLLVDEEYGPYIKNNMKVLISLDSYPNEVFTGFIKSIEAQSDRSQRTLKVKADVDYKDKTVIFNMTVEGNIILDEIEGIFVPVTAYKDGYVEVFSKGKVEKRQVKIDNFRVNGQYRVLEGLKEGERIIVP